MEKHYVLIVIAFTYLIGNGNAQTPDYLWAKSAGGTYQESGQNCSTDASGNIFATGTFSSDTVIFGTTVLTNMGDGDIFIVKYDPSGNVLWAKSGGGNNYDSNHGCSTDAGGNIIVTGHFQSDSIIFGTTVLTNTGDDDMFIVKYNPVGNLLWAKSAGGITDDHGCGCSTDAAGNIFVTGFFQSPTITFGTTVLTNSGNNDMFIVKYDSGGNVLWAKSGVGSSYDWGYSCSTDGGGNIIAAGYFESYSITFGTTVLTNAGGIDMFIVKYDSSGNVLWAESAGGTATDQFTDCSTDTDGNIFATGTFNSSALTFGTTILPNAGDYDMFIVKFGPDGNVLWAKSAGGTEDDRGLSSSIYPGGNNIVTGSFGSSTITFGTTGLTNAYSIFLDMFIVKYDSSGNVLWAKSAGGSYNDLGFSCSTDAGGNIIATGQFSSSTINFGSILLTNSGLNDMFIVKLDTSTLMGVTAVANASNNVLLFPNPAAGHFTIAFGTSNKKVDVTITNMTGKVISTSVSTETQNLKVNTNDFEEGVYFVRIQTEDLIDTKKIIVAK